MKRALVPGSLVLLLALCSCSGPETTGERAEATPAPTTAQADESKPLTAEAPTASGEDSEAAFLERIRAKLRPDNVIPNATDEQLVAAGKTACEAIANGEDTITLSVIDGEKTDASGFFPDSAVIISAARSTICD